MNVSETVYLDAAAHVDATTPAPDTARPERGYAAQAANAVARLDTRPVAALYHVASRPPASPDLNLAAKVLDGADLPHRGAVRAETVANGTHGFFDALEKASSAVMHGQLDGESLIYLTAGDAGPVDQHVDAPPREHEGVSLALGQAPSHLQLLSLLTWTDPKLQHLIDQGAGRRAIADRSATLLCRVADDILTDAVDRRGMPRWLDDLSHIITPYPTGSAAHRNLLTTLGANAPAAAQPPTSRATRGSGPLVLMRELAHLVSALTTPPGPYDDLTILAISDCEDATVSAAVFELT